MGAGAGGVGVVSVVDNLRAVGGAFGREEKPAGDEGTF